MALLNEAYSVLSDPEKRRAYDSRRMVLPGNRPKIIRVETHLLQQEIHPKTQPKDRGNNIKITVHTMTYHHCKFVFSVPYI